MYLKRGMKGYPRMGTCLNRAMEMASLSNLQQLGHELHIAVSSNPLLFSTLFVSVLLLFRNRLVNKGSKLDLPSSPRKLPIIGHLHLLGKLPHRSLQAVSEKYGPLMLLYLGQTPTLVVSSAETAMEVLKTHDDVFSNRPQTTAAKIFLYGCTDIGFSPAGDFHRQVKKICVRDLLCLKRVQSFQFIREEEVKALIDKLRCACDGGASVNLSQMLLAIANNIISRCVLGQKAEEEGGKSKFGELSKRMMMQFMAFSFGDMFPALGWMDNLTGLNGSLKATFRELDAFLDQVIEEHRTVDSDDHLFGRLDLVHTILQLQKKGMLDVALTEDNIKAILMDMFVGGTHTTATTMEWMMAELTKHNKVLRKAQEEVRRVVGGKSRVEPHDIDQMNFLKCIVKETLRLHPPVPLLVPRQTSASVRLRGYTIPPKTTVLVNALAIQTDPKVWDGPEQFLPERFEKEKVDFRRRDFDFLAFGGGRRGCPGISFGVAAVEFVIANLLYWFDWKLPGGESPEDLDMNEAYGLSVSKKVPLHLVPALYSP